MASLPVVPRPCFRRSWAPLAAALRFEAYAKGRRDGSQFRIPDISLCRRSAHDCEPNPQNLIGRLCLEELTTVLATASSNAALPQIMRKLERTRVEEQGHAS
jgi:hypothetical protein